MSNSQVLLRWFEEREELYRRSEPFSRGVMCYGVMWKSRMEVYNYFLSKDVGINFSQRTWRWRTAGKADVSSDVTRIVEDKNNWIDLP
jgi:hypothetical protein